MSRSMQLQLEFQRNSVADEVAAITAVVRPILTATLYALKQDVVDELGGFESVKLKLLPRLYRAGDGDCGLSFEYAVHDALNRGESAVLGRMTDAMSAHCNLPGQEASSILFGAEKAGALQLIDTAIDRLTPESVLLYGTRGRPVKLKNHIKSVAAAFRKRDARESLPWSIRGLWKADLFVGYLDSDKWVGTTVKINPTHLEAARGLRIGVVPARQGASDAIRRDETRNLVVCPLPHDGAFMEVFYQGWGVVQQVLDADAGMPREVALPRPPERQVAKYLVDRREFPVVDVVEALGPLSQPELLQTRSRDANVLDTRDSETETGGVVAPVARRVGKSA